MGIEQPRQYFEEVSQAIGLPDIFYSHRGNINSTSITKGFSHIQKAMERRIKYSEEYQPYWNEHPLLGRIEYMTLLNETVAYNNYYPSTHFCVDAEPTLAHNLSEYGTDLYKIPIVVIDTDASDKVVGVIKTHGDHTLYAIQDSQKYNLVRGGWYEIDDIHSLKPDSAISMQEIMQHINSRDSFAPENVSYYPILGRSSLFLIPPEIRVQIPGAIVESHQQIADRVKALAQKALHQTVIIPVT